MNIRRDLLAAGAVVVALSLVACQSSAPAGTKEIVSQDAGGLKITLLNESGELTQGDNQFRMTFQTAGGQAADAGNVTVSCSMSMPGMPPMVAPLEAKPAGTGEFAMNGTFSMSGAWTFEIRWDGPAGSGATTLNTSVR
ncbi:MAG: FixH family protein [Bryobacteraceae bacterium]